jgi:hypothetical protein
MDNIEEILRGLSNDCRRMLKYYPLRKDSRSKVVVLGDKEKYNLFKRYFDKATRNRYKERVEHLQELPEKHDDLYIIEINYLL